MASNAPRSRKRKNTAAARRPKHLAGRSLNKRPDRASAFPAELELLNLDTPIGVYKTDIIAKEFFETGVFSTLPDLQKVRELVNEFGADAFQIAQKILITWPNDRRLTKRFFDDLSRISYLIDRNKAFNELRFYITWRDRLGPADLERINKEDATQSLQNKLEDLSSEIRRFLSLFEPWTAKNDDGLSEPSNYDPLSLHFIFNSWFVWTALRPLPDDKGMKLPRSDYRLFARFLAAIWSDVNFR